MLADSADLSCGRVAERAVKVGFKIP